MGEFLDRHVFRLYDSSGWRQTFPYTCSCKTVIANKWQRLFHLIGRNGADQ